MGLFQDPALQANVHAFKCQMNASRNIIRQFDWSAWVMLVILVVVCLGIMTAAGIGLYRFFAG
jgi:hypothetical protein